MFPQNCGICVGKETGASQAFNINILYDKCMGFTPDQQLYVVLCDACTSQVNLKPSLKSRRASPLNPDDIALQIGICRKKRGIQVKSEDFAGPLVEICRVTGD